MKSVLATEMTDPGDGAIAAASFVAIEVDMRGAAVYEHLQGTPVASCESVGGGSTGGKEGLALAVQAGEEQRSLEA